MIQNKLLHTKKLSHIQKEIAPKAKRASVQKIGADHYKMAFEQYKLLVETINKLNETRELSNSIWIGANGAWISILAYVKGITNISTSQKTFFLITLITVGIIFASSWLSYLKAIKQAIEVRSLYLVELEKHFPVPVFSSVLGFTGKPLKKAVFATLTAREMFVPCIFLVTYIFFLFALYFFPSEGFVS